MALSRSGPLPAAALAAAAGRQAGGTAAAAARTSVLQPGISEGVGTACGKHGAPGLRKWTGRKRRDPVEDTTCLCAVQALAHTNSVQQCPPNGGPLPTAAAAVVRRQAARAVPWTQPPVAAMTAWLVTLMQPRWGIDERLEDAAITAG